MFGNLVGGWHWIIILLIVLLLFGAPKLPGLARSLGKSVRIMRSELKPEHSDTDDGRAARTNEPSAEKQHPKSPRDDL